MDKPIPDPDTFEEIDNAAGIFELGILAIIAKFNAPDGGLMSGA